MESYIVLFFKPLSKKRHVGKFEVDNLSDAKKLAENKKKLTYDVLIIKKTTDISKNHNEKDSKEQDIYEIVKYGYYNVYNVLNIIFVIISFLIFVYFLYLYYIFFYKP